MKKKWRGPTEIWTRIAGFKVQSANHYTMGPMPRAARSYESSTFINCVVIVELLVSESASNLWKSEAIVRPCGATVARLTPDQKVACSNHVGVRVKFCVKSLQFPSFLIQTKLTKSWKWISNDDLHLRMTISSNIQLYSSFFFF